MRMRKHLTIAVVVASLLLLAVMPARAGTAQTAREAHGWDCDACDRDEVHMSPDGADHGCDDPTWREEKDAVAPDAGPTVADTLTEDTDDLAGEGPAEAARAVEPCDDTGESAGGDTGESAGGDTGESAGGDTDESTAGVSTDGSLERDEPQEHPDDVIDVSETVDVAEDTKVADATSEELAATGIDSIGALLAGLGLGGAGGGMLYVSRRRRGSAL